ncbi:MAG: hypothetical protein ACRYF2_14880 [Janthinobacterium lividum]
MPLIASLTRNGRAQARAQIPTHKASGLITTDRQLIVFAFALAGLFSLLPLAFVQWPPLIDYLPHLSRVFIEHSLLTDGRFADRFTWNLRVVPNLGLDAVVLPLTLLGMPLDLAGKLFVALVILLNGTAVTFLHKALFGRLSPVPLIAFAFSYTELLIFGFLTSEVATALALLAFAAYLRHPITVSTLRLLTFVTAVVTGLFFVHLLGALVFLGLVAADAVSSRWIAPALSRLALVFRHSLIRPARLLPVAVAVAVSGLALLALLSLAPLSASNTGEDAASAADFLKPKFWRWRLMINPLLGYDPKIDLPILTLLIFALAVFLFYGRVRIAGTTLLAMAGLTIAYFFVPVGWGSTYYIPERFPFILMLLGIASIDIKFNTSAGRRAATFVIFTLVLARSLSAVAAWTASSEARRPLLEALAHTGPSDTVCQSRNAADNIHGDAMFPLINLTSYATINNGAFAYVFALQDQNLIAPRPEWASVLKQIEINNRTDRNPVRPLPQQDLTNPAVLKTCTFMLVTRPDLYQLAFPNVLQPIASVPGATFFRVEHRASTPFASTTD